MWHYWDNKTKSEIDRKVFFDMVKEQRIGPDDGCYHCRFNENNNTCLLSGYNIAHQTGPACARFKER